MAELGSKQPRKSDISKGHCPKKKSRKKSDNFRYDRLLSIK